MILLLCVLVQGCNPIVLEAGGAPGLKTYIPGPQNEASSQKKKKQNKTT